MFRCQCLFLFYAQRFLGPLSGNTQSMTENRPETGGFHLNSTKIVEKSQKTISNAPNIICTKHQPEICQGPANARIEQDQPRPNHGPTVARQGWHQPWARLPKVQPRVGPTRASQDPNKARPVASHGLYQLCARLAMVQPRAGATRANQARPDQWPARGCTSLGQDWPRSRQGLD